MNQPLDQLASDIAAELWSFLPDLSYRSRRDLTDDILGLIFRVQAESLAADGSHIIEWYHELPLNDRAVLACEVEQIAGGPQHFSIYYIDDEDSYLPIREWRDSSGAAVLQRLVN